VAYDVFISYAHVDNEPLPGATEGWVTTFVKGLKYKLAQELGRLEAYQLWMDYELRGNDSITPTIHSILDEVGHLVVFLSKGYVASTWCLEELARFVARTGADSRRVFVVYMAPVDEVPSSLVDKKKYSFWREDNAGRPRTLGVPTPDPTQREYYNLMEDVARDLAAEIVASRAPETARQEREAAPASGPVFPRVDAGEVCPEAPPDAQGPCAEPGVIFVNSGEDDLALVRDVGKYLQSHGYGCVLPLQAVPGFDPSRVRPTELRRDLQRNLKGCDAVIMLYRTGPVTQVREHISAWRSAAARRKTSPPPLDLFQELPDPMAVGVSYPGMHVCVLPQIRPEDCVQKLADEGLGSGEGGP